MLLFIATSCFSQSIDYRDVISCAGGSFSHPQVGSFEWSIGEPVVDVFDSCVLTQGFHQTGQVSGCVTTSSFETEWETYLYPNPATDYLQISTDQPIDRMLLYASNGVLMINKTDYHSPDQLDISQLEAGSYFIRIESAQEFKTLSFIKIKY